MTEKQVEGKARRQRYSAEFKRQALLRAVKDGVPAVARDLGLQPAVVRVAWKSAAARSGRGGAAAGAVGAGAAQA